MENNIFRKKSLDKISSPDKIDDYLKVSTPSVWIILGALFLAVFAVGVWCVCGNIPTTVSGTGIQKGDEIWCFIDVDDSYYVVPGMKVEILPGGSDNLVFGLVQEVGSPQSAEAVWNQMDAGWLNLSGEWVCPVRIDMREYSSEILPEGVECAVNIILEERSPLEMLLGGEVRE